MACSGREISIKLCLIQSERSPRTGPRFNWHRQVLTDGADKGVALKTSTEAVELPGNCPYSGVQGTNS